MRNLDFTLATLPSLIRNGPCPFANESAFWDSISHVPSTWSSETGEVFMGELSRTYRDWDYHLRLALAARRAGKLGREAPSGAEESGPWKELAELALSQGNPEAVEQFLFERRWDFLDQKEAGHSLDFVVFQAYVLKLRLLLRKADWTLDRGRGIFKKLHSTILSTTDLTIPRGTLS